MRRSYSVADVSVCMAYWRNRSDVEITLRSLPLDVEICLCDDGSESKQVALNPCVPLNIAVRASTRSVIVLTNPGAELRAGMLERMLAELDQNTYVAAACRDDMTGQWLCHSTWRSSEKLPSGAGFHFLAMLERSLWDRAGGFDERYRDGQAYEDADFLWRLHGAGARFKILDDVVIGHRRSTTVWPAGGLERNRELYRSIRAAA